MIKRTADIFLSLIALLLLWPIYLIIALLIYIDSPGPVFFLQERVGQNGKRFRIIKFRTMYQDAEKSGPQLSNDMDKRVTHMGRYLRRYRIDELPQFINILIGDMSLVGPRPERDYFIQQLTPLTADFPKLLKVKPGLTSWGQVKYGYASTIEQIAERMQYDLYYIEHYSLSFDLKVLLYTIRIVLSGKGV